MATHNSVDIYLTSYLYLHSTISLLSLLTYINLVSFTAKYLWLVVDKMATQDQTKKVRLLLHVEVSDLGLLDIYSHCCCVDTVDMYCVDTV